MGGHRRMHLISRWTRNSGGMILMWRGILSCSHNIHISRCHRLLALMFVGLIAINVVLSTPLPSLQLHLILGRPLFIIWDIAVLISTGMVLRFLMEITN
uniref:Uncharacterized protein n=1 Tax=Arundo donax TaxID=35708 RepID=A0A0A9A6Y5_ARUDO